MIQAFYSATVGAQQQMQRMDVHANNISNVNTQGFKAQVPSFQALMYGMQEGIGGEQLPRGTGDVMALTSTNMDGGALVETDRDLDYAIVGDGFFALYDPGTGEVSFTRDGSFTIASLQTAANTRDAGDPADGPQEVYYLCDGEGRQVLGPDGYPIVMDDTTTQPSIGVFSIQYVDGLERAGSSRFLTGNKNGMVYNSNASVRQGFLESSNADLATELTGVIEAQRSYSYVLKMLTTADEVETTINNLTNG